MDRQKDEVAAAIFEQFIPQTKIRKTCLAFLADSILSADRFNGDRWGVTLARDVVRLNVGKPEALCIFPGYLHVVLDIYTLPKVLMPRRDGLAVEGRNMRWKTKGLYLWGNKNDLKLGVYSSVPGSISCNVDSSLCSSWLPLVRDSHHAFLEKAALTARNPETKSAHSPNVISFLSSYLNRELPQPSYFARRLLAYLEPDPLPEEVVEPNQYYEGSVGQIAVNVYERSPEARKRCIDHYGLACVVCGLSFEERYGKAGEGFINIHHLEPLSNIRASYKLDAIKDLRPVCPNCHAIIHRKSPPYRIDAVRRMLRDRNS